MDPVSCPKCGARFPVSKFDDNERTQLSDQRSFEMLHDEQQMLLKVQRYYERHPHVEGQIQPDFLRMLHSDDANLHEQLAAGVPFDQIEFRHHPALAPPVEDVEDAEVVEYLKHNSFELKRRLEFVNERVMQLANSIRGVTCLHCGDSLLRVRPEDWDAFTEPDSVTWYWPDWHGFGDNGDLTVKASGFQGGDHWTGAHTVEVDNPDYAFWKWLVKQPQYHRIVQEDELPAIREEFARTQFS